MMTSSIVTCPKCRRWYDPGQEPDPCIGELPGVADDRMYRQPEHVGERQRMLDQCRRCNG